ncbi:MAG: hypothetical protein E5X09_01410 [Mesorhizobium sp.]|nr:MAG: hypothetical protein E5X09_01410 [Mesorhizobium sp.]
MAKTDFSTWEYTFDREFMGRGLMWPALLGEVLKGTWPTTKAGTTLDIVQKNIKVVRQFRNRLSHHEPIWKKFHVLDEKDVVAHLNEKIDSIENLIGIFSPDALNLLKRNNFLAYSRMACSLQEISRFKYRTETHNVKTFSKMKHITSLNLAQGGLLNIKIYSDRKRKFLMVPVNF